MPLHCEVCASVAVVILRRSRRISFIVSGRESEILRLRLRMTVMQFSRSDTLPKWRQMFFRDCGANPLESPCFKRPFERFFY
jgi:hypothetical protein